MCGAPRATIFSAKIARMGPSRGVCHTAPGAGVPHGTKGQAGVRPGTAAIRAFFAWEGPRRGSGCPPVIAAVQLDQHTLSGHPLAAPPVLGWAPAPQGGPADGDTLALGQQLTEMRVVGTFVLRTSQPAGAGASGLSLPVGKDQSYPAQPGVGRRHHLLAHGPGIPLPGGHHGLAQPVRWLGDCPTSLEAASASTPHKGYALPHCRMWEILP